MIDKLYRILFLSDLHGTRVILAISELIWAIALLTPGVTFERSKTYSGMADVCSEEIWGLVWLCSAIIQFYIVWSEDYHSQAAIWFAGFNATIWWIVVCSLYLNVWPLNAVASADFALAIAASWIWIRSGWIPKGAYKWM